MEPKVSSGAVATSSKTPHDNTEQHEENKEKVLAPNRGNKRKATEELEENNNKSCELTEKRAKVMEQPQTVTPNAQQMYYQSIQPVILDQNMVLQQNVSQNHQSNQNHQNLQSNQNHQNHQNMSLQQNMNLQQNIGLQQNTMVQQSVMHHQQQPNSVMQHQGMQHQGMLAHGLVQQNIAQNVIQPGFSQDGSVPGGLQLNQMGQLVYQPQVQYVQASQHGYGAIGSNYGQIVVQNGMGLSQNGGVQHIHNGLQPVQQGLQSGIQHGLQPGFQHSIQSNIQQIPQSYQTNFTYARPQIIQATHPDLLQNGHQSVHTQSITSSFNHLTNHQNLTLNQYQPSSQSALGQFRQPTSSIPLLQPLSNHPIVPNPSGYDTTLMMQKRKKPSPSARRRSRMRLLAFIEAKKKSAEELEALEGKVGGNLDGVLEEIRNLEGHLDGNSESTSSENLISSQVSEIGKDELKITGKSDTNLICTGTRPLKPIAEAVEKRSNSPDEGISDSSSKHAQI